MLAITGYALLRFVHVLLAIAAVGFNMSYGIWLARAAREPEHESHVLAGGAGDRDRVHDGDEANLLES